MKNSYKVFCALAVGLSTILFCACQSGTTRGPFIFKNDGEGAKTSNDFHVIFTGSGGQLTNPKVTKPADAKPTINPSTSNQVDVVFPTPVAKDGTVEITVDCPSEIKCSEAWWTVDSVKVSVAKCP